MKEYFGNETTDVDTVVLKGNCNIIRLYKVRNETMLCPWWARHETPVLASPLRIIHVDEELLVLDKPCSLPVSHALGPFYHHRQALTGIWTLKRA